MNILQAMKDALECFEICKEINSEPLSIDSAIVSLRSAIAAYEQQIEEMEKAEPAVELHVSESRTITGTGGKTVNLQRGWNKLYLHPAPAIPEGWQLVPKSTTCDMDSAGSKAHYKNWDGSPIVTESDAESIYIAMLAAAPEYKP